MADDFEIHGAEQFFALSKALKNTGRVEMRKGLNKALVAAAKPLIARTRAAALAELPKHGGLAAAVAKAPQRVQVRTGAATAGVRIVASGPVKGANSGTVRHPVFGKKGVFVEQKVHGGWFDDTLAESAPEVRPHLEAALEAIAEKVIREAKT